MDKTVTEYTITDFLMTHGRGHLHLTAWKKKLFIILAANPLTRWQRNKEAVERVIKVLDNARDYTDAAFVKNVLNGGQKGLNGAFCSPHYVLEGHYRSCTTESVSLS